MDWFTQLLQWLSAPDFAALLTITGLAIVLKTIAIPFIKWAATKVHMDISGTKTTFVVYLLAIIIAFIAQAVTHGDFGVIALYHVVTTAILAATSALGFQSTLSAILRPDKINKK